MQLKKGGKESMEGDHVHFFVPLNNKNRSEKDMFIRSGGIEGTGQSGMGTISQLEL